MRVLHLGKYFPPVPGGIEFFLADLVAAQRAQGLQVAALVHRESLGGRSPTPTQAGPSSGIYAVPCLGRLLYAPLCPSFPLWLGRAIRDFKPDLLHLHLPNTSAFATLAHPRARRLPWVVHWHADVVASTIDWRLALAYRLYRPLEQRLLKEASAIIVTSPPYLESSLALASWRERCVDIPLGLNPARLPVPDDQALSLAQARWGNQSGLRVLAVGRLTYYKGYEVLIRAVAALPPDVQVLIVGKGEGRPSLVRLIRDLGLVGRVQLIGYAPPMELAALFTSCDLLCLPSLERTEAFGLVLLEAMQYAKPLVVSDIPGSGAPWVVRRVGNGRLIRPGDPHDLARALADLRAEPQARRRLGAAGPPALAREFGIGPVATAIENLYRQVLAQPGPGTGAHPTALRP